MLDYAKRDQLINQLIPLEGLKVSLYLPTHRAFPDNRQDPIQYKNLLQQLEAELEKHHPRRDWQAMMDRLKALLDDTDLWLYATEGLAVLAAGEQVHTFRLDAPAGPLYTLGEHLHLLPLYPVLPPLEAVYVADISQDRVNVQRASREGLAPMELPELKKTMSELFEDFDAEGNLRTGSYGGAHGAFHGHDSRSEGVARDRVKYFRYLDDAFAKLIKDSHLPMILAGTTASVTEFRQVAKGNFYLSQGIDRPLEALSADEAMKQITKLIKPRLEQELNSLKTLIINKQKDNKTTQELAAIREAAQSGRVEALLLPGTLPANEQALLDEAISHTLQNGGQVYHDPEGLLALDSRRLALMRY